MNILRGKWVGAILCAMVLLTGCGKGSNTEIDGVEGPKVSFANGMVTTTMLFRDLSVDAGATIPIPKYPNSSFQIAPDFQSGGLLVSLSLSVADYLGDQGEAFDPQTLPGGRMLPGVEGGALPAVAVVLPTLSNSVLYVGPSVIGLFVPFKKLDIGGAIITSRFFDSQGNRIGNLSLVGSDQNGENAGILVLMDPDLLGINGEEARIDRLTHFYKLGYR